MLIDGRTVYTTLLAGTYWEVQDTVMDDIDRIEVIRGPGGTIWGPNAVNGVINVITKPASETQGNLPPHLAEMWSRVRCSVRHGARSGNVDYRATRRALTAPHNSTPTIASSTIGGPCREAFASTGQKATRDGFTLAGGYLRRTRRRKRRCNKLYRALFASP